MSSATTTTFLLAIASLVQCGSALQRQGSLAFVASSSASRSSTSSRVLKDQIPVVALRSSSESETKDEEGSGKTESGLPEVKGDFDWDAKFKDDPDWITEDVPGKIVLDEVTLAKQVTALDQLETKWRKGRLQREYEESKKVGFVAEAELMNGRFAMFFLVTGLLTELWTGFSMPQQVEEMLRVFGVIGFDG